MRNIWSMICLLKCATCPFEVELSVEGKKNGCRWGKKCYSFQCEWKHSWWEAKLLCTHHVKKVVLSNITQTTDINLYTIEEFKDGKKAGAVWTLYEKARTISSSCRKKILEYYRVYFFEVWSIQIQVLVFFIFLPRNNSISHKKLRATSTYWFFLFDDYRKKIQSELLFDFFLDRLMTIM